MLYSGCPPGGAVSHRATDLHSAEETGRHSDSQETSGKNLMITQVYIQLTVPIYNILNSAQSSALTGAFYLAKKI